MVMREWDSQGDWVHLHIFFSVLLTGTTFVISCLLFRKTKALYKRVYSEKKDFAPWGANSFL